MGKIRLKVDIAIARLVLEELKRRTDEAKRQYELALKQFNVAQQEYEEVRQKIEEAEAKPAAESAPPTPDAAPEADLDPADQSDAAPTADYVSKKFWDAPGFDWSEYIQSKIESEDVPLNYKDFVDFMDAKNGKEKQEYASIVTKLLTGLAAGAQKKLVAVKVEGVRGAYYALPHFLDEQGGLLEEYKGALERKMGRPFNVAE